MLNQEGQGQGSGVVDDAKQKRDGAGAGEVDPTLAAIGELNPEGEAGEADDDFDPLAQGAARGVVFPKMGSGEVMIGSRARAQARPLAAGDLDPESLAAQFAQGEAGGDGVDPVDHDDLQDVHLSASQQELAAAARAQQHLGDDEALNRVGRHNGGGGADERKEGDEEEGVEVHGLLEDPIDAQPTGWRPWAPRPRQADTVTPQLSALLAEWKASAPQIVEVAVRDHDDGVVEHVRVEGEGVVDEPDGLNHQAERKGAGSRRGSAHRVHQEVVVQFDEAAALRFIKRNFDIVEVAAEEVKRGAGAPADAEVDGAPVAAPTVKKFAMKAYPDVVVDPALVFGFLDKYKFDEQFNVDLGDDLKATEFSGERFCSKSTAAWFGITAALVLESAFAGTTAAGSQIDDFRVCPTGADFSWDLPSLLGWGIPMMSFVSILANVHNMYTYAGTPRSGDLDGMVKVIQGRIAELIHDLKTMGVPQEQAEAFAKDILLFAKKADGFLFSRKPGWTEIRAFMSLYNKIVLGMAMMILMVGGGKPIPDTFHLIGALLVGFIAGLIEGADASWGPFYMGQLFQEIFAFIRRGILPPLAPEKEATFLARLAKSPLLGLILAFNGPFVLGVGRLMLSVFTNWQQLGLVTNNPGEEPVDMLGSYKGLWLGVGAFSVGLYMEMFRRLNLEHNLHHLMPDRDLRNLNEDNWSRFAGSLMPAAFLTGGLYGGLTGVLSNIEALGFAATYLSILAGISLKALPDAVALTKKQKAKQFAQSVAPHMVNFTASLYISEAMGTTSSGDAAMSGLMFMIITAVMMAVPIKQLPTIIGNNYLTKKVLEPVLTLTVPCGYKTLAKSERPSLNTLNLALSSAALSALAILIAVGADLGDIDNMLVTMATATTTYLASMSLSAILFRKNPEYGLRIPYIPGPGGAYFAAFVDAILKSIVKLVVGFSGGNVAATSDTLLNPDGLGFAGSRVAVALLPFPAIAAAQADANAFVPVILADHKHLDDKHVVHEIQREPSAVGRVGAHQQGQHEDEKQNGDVGGVHGQEDGHEEDADVFHALADGEQNGVRRVASFQVEDGKRDEAAPGDLHRLTSSLTQGAQGFSRAMSGYWRHGLHKTAPLIPASRSMGGTVRTKGAEQKVLGVDSRIRPVHDQQRRNGADVPLLGYGSFHGSAQRPTPQRPGLQGLGVPQPLVGGEDDGLDLEAAVGHNGGGDQPAAQTGWRAKIGGWFS